MPIDWRRREKAARFDHGGPLSRASSLPFAILLSTLVLVLGSFQKVPDHALVIDLPVTNGLGRPFSPWPKDLPTHELRLTASGTIWWDDEVVNLSLLVQHLRDATATKPHPGLIFLPDGNTSYNLVAHTLNIVAQSGVASDRLCLAGLEEYRDFNRGNYDARLMLDLVVDGYADSLAPPTEPLPCGVGNIRADPTN